MTSLRSLKMTSLTRVGAYARGGVHRDLASMAAYDSPHFNNIIVSREAIPCAESTGTLGR